jgi:peptidoglycan/xylan/chitin deacetylase (PgdA/CDA1 family)
VTAEDVARVTVEKARDRGDGAIVLLHSWPASTGEAMPELLARLEDAGARCATVDELIGVEP